MVNLTVLWVRTFPCSLEVLLREILNSITFENSLRVATWFQKEENMSLMLKFS